MCVYTCRRIPTYIKMYVCAPPRPTPKAMEMQMGGSLTAVCNGSLTTLVSQANAKLGLHDVYKTKIINVVLQNADANNLAEIPKSSEMSNVFMLV